MNKIYCISGLGADEQIFYKLQIPGYSFEYIQWLIPAGKESIDAYAARMAQTIEEEQPILMGLSFGGMMCMEIAKILQPKKIILISSVKSVAEMPVWMRLAGKLKINKAIPMRPYKILEPVQNIFIGAVTQEDKALVRQYRSKTSPVYLNWAIQQILNWKSIQYPPQVFHIHGDADKIFPIKKIAATHVVKNGGHLMLYNKAGEVSDIINTILAG